MLNALFAARWERDYYEADEQIMRDGKWIHHKPHDMGEIIHLLVFTGTERKRKQIIMQRTEKHMYYNMRIGMVAR